MHLPGGPFDAEARREGGRLVVVARGELDLATVGHVRARLAERAAHEGLELDLRELRFVDTSGLQLLVELHRDARERGYELRIRRGTPQVQRVFEIAGLDGVLPFVDGDPAAR